MPLSCEQIALEGNHVLGQKASILGYDITSVIVDVDIKTLPVTESGNLSDRFGRKGTLLKMVTALRLFEAF